MKPNISTHQGTVEREELQAVRGQKQEIWFMMTSREIVARTLAFSGPERVARSFADGDFVHACYGVETPATEWCEVGGGRWERTDEWGNLWARVDPTSKGEVARGALNTLAEQDRLVLPDFSRPVDYGAVRAARAAHPGKFLLGSLPGFTFNIARKLRRLDQYLIDLYTADEEAVKTLHDRIDRLLEDMILNYAASGADGIMFGEDWGTQQQLLISPPRWRREFEPRFHRLCGLAREKGLAVFMHSCGYIADIIPALAGAGVQVLQFDQPQLYGVEALASFQDRLNLAFWCPVDIQKTLPTGDEELIRARARELLDKLWRNGGFIAGYYEDNPSIGVDPAWQVWACDTFLRQGVRTTKNGQRRTS